jgi:hypothetical protein
MHKVTHLYAFSNLRLPLSTLGSYLPSYIRWIYQSALINLPEPGDHYSLPQFASLGSFWLEAQVSSLQV